MEWLIFSLFRALFVSGKETCMKLSLLHSVPSVTISAFYTTIVSVIILMPFVLWDGSWRSIDNQMFVFGIIGNVCLNTIGHLLLLTTIKRFDISYVSAVLATSPMIFGVFSLVFLGVSPSVYAFLCMGIIALGGVLVELSREKTNSFKSFVLHSGWLPLLAYLCIAAGATVFSKIAVSNGDPEAYIAFRYCGLSMIFLFIHCVYESELGHNTIKREREPIKLRFDMHAVIAGLFLMCAVICEMNALKLTDMASVEAITKFAIIGTLFVDTVFISKHFNKKRWFGATLILTGGIGVILL